MGELRKFETNQATITGISGKKYVLGDSLSLAEYIQAQKMEHEAAFGEGAMAHYNGLMEAFAFLNGNQVKHGDACIKIHDLMNGMKGMLEESRAPQMVRLCAVIYREEGADRGSFTEKDVDQFVEDMQDVDMQFFFEQAVSSLPSLLAAYKAIFLGTSSQTEHQDSQSPQSPTTQGS